MRPTPTFGIIQISNPETGISGGPKYGPDFEDSLSSICRDTAHYQDKSRFSHPDMPDTCFTCDMCEVNLSPDGEILWPNRCSSCNTRLKRWQRMQIWKPAVSATTKRLKGSRARLVTFTTRHSYIPCEYDSMGFLKGCPVSVPESTKILVDNFRRMNRSVHWQRQFEGGGLWVAECTKKIIRQVDYSWAHLDAEQLRGVAPLPRMGFSWSVHPHIHCILIGKFIDIPSLSKLALKYGFDNVDVKLLDSNSTSTKLNYLSSYLGKEQPLPRSRDTFGILRKEASRIRKELEEKRRFFDTQER